MSSASTKESVFVRVSDGDMLIQMLSTKSDTISFHRFRALPNYVAVKGTKADIESLLLDPNIDTLDDHPRFLANDNIGLRVPRKRALMTGQSIDYGVELIRAPEAHNLGYTGQGIHVCVVDSGIDITHPDIDSNKFSGGGPFPWNSDGYGHGTYVTGIIAALDNNEGTLGAAFDASIYMQTIIDDSGGGTTTAVIMEAVEDCVIAGAQIINLSLGGRNYSAAEEDFYRNIRKQHGVLVVAAGGNGGNAAYTYPAAYDTVLAVATVDQDKKVTDFSQKNDRIDLAAPGVSILSLLPITGNCTLCEGQSGGYGTMIGGSSFSAPHVTAAAATVWSAVPQSNVSRVEEALFAAAEDLGTEGYDTSYGHGLVNVVGSIEYLLGCKTFKLAMHTDRAGKEIGILLENSNTGDVIWDIESLEDSAVYTRSECLDPEDCHTFTVTDSAGDGICCDWGAGNFTVSFAGEEYISDGQYGSTLTEKFGNCPTLSPTQVPTQQPTEQPTPEATDFSAIPTSGNGVKIGIGLGAAAFFVVALFAFLRKKRKKVEVTVTDTPTPGDGSDPPAGEDGNGPIQTDSGIQEPQQHAVLVEDEEYRPTYKDSGRTVDHEAEQAVFAPAVLADI